MKTSVPICVRANEVKMKCEASKEEERLLQHIHHHGLRGCNQHLSGSKMFLILSDLTGQLFLYSNQAVVILSVIQL